MQLAAKPFSEPTLFRAAHAYETAMAWRAEAPGDGGVMRWGAPLQWRVKRSADLQVALMIHERTWRSALRRL